MRCLIIIIVKLIFFQLLFEIFFIGISVEGYLIRNSFKGTKTSKRSYFEIPVLQHRSVLVSDSFLSPLRASSTTKTKENRTAHIMWAICVIATFLCVIIWYLNTVIDQTFRTLSHCWGWLPSHFLYLSLHLIRLSLKQLC